MPGTIINGMSYYCDMTSCGSHLFMPCLDPQSSVWCKNLWRRQFRANL